MFEKCAQWIYQFRVPLLVITGLFILPLAYLSSDVFPHLTPGGFEDPQGESKRASGIISDEIGVGEPDLVVVYSAPKGSVIDDIECVSAGLELVTRLEKEKDLVRSVTSYFTTGVPVLLNQDRTKTFMKISVKGDDREKPLAIEKLLPLLKAEPMTHEIGGYMPVNIAVQRIIKEDLIRAEMIALPITAILLLIIFGSFVSMLLPVIIGILSIITSLGILKLMTYFIPVSMFAVNVVTLLGLGLAIDYSLFMVNRFREEMYRQKNNTDAALKKTMATTGRAVLFSGVTVAVSLISLSFFPQMFLKSMSIGGVVVVIGTMLLSLTTLPAILALVGSSIDRGKIRWIKTYIHDDNATGFWQKIAFGVMKYPAVIAVVVSIALIVMGLPFLRFQPSFADYRVLPIEEPAFIANSTLDREFLGKQMTPIELAVQVKEGHVFDENNIERLKQLQTQLRAIPHIQNVNSLFSLNEVLEDGLLEKNLKKDKSNRDPNIQMAIDAFASDKAIQFSALSAFTFNDPRSIEAMKSIRAMDIPGLEISVGGASAFLDEMITNLLDRTPWMIAFVFGAMFVILFLLFGSISIPIKAMIMNSLSLTASFGVIVWIFQDGRLANLLNYTPLYISDSTQPLLMFAIVFGLSMDYEVLLLARIREEYIKTNNNDLSVARGLASTGRLITSAAILLVVVIGAFGTSRIVFLKSLGIGMALAILLDATIVRALLVPALMKLMGHWNWWSPKFLKRLWEKSGFSDMGEH